MTAPFNTIAIIPKPSKPEALALAEQVAGWLIEQGRAVVCEAGGPLVPGTAPLPADELVRRADLIVVLGGDGTLLHAAQLCVRREVPLLGVNLGTLGFMTDVPRARTFDALAKVLAGEYRIERRTKLQVRLVRGEELLFEHEVLNDAVINKNALARIADLEAFVEGRPLTNFKADGVIVATPTGSSAYSLAAGGPLVHPAVCAMLLVPICPHALTQRPIVLPDDQEVVLCLKSVGEMFVTLDGQVGQPLEQGDRLIVRRAPTAALLVRTDHNSFYDVLREKLKWGER